MKRLQVLSIMLTAALLAGCQMTGSPPGAYADDGPDTTGASLAMAKVEAVDNAVIRQRTIYAYHFFDESAELNELGHRDITILARHFMKYPGTLNVYQAGASAALYQARVQAVVAAFNEAGVPRGGIEIADHAPGGEGISSANVLLMVEAQSIPDVAAEQAPIE